MKNPHEQQAAAMSRAGELPDGEQLRECINSGQVSAAQVVAHAEAGELSRPVAHRFDIMEGIESKVGSWLYSDGPPKESPFASMQALFTEEQMRAALSAERAEVARLRGLLSDALNFMENMDPDESFNPPTAHWAKALTTDLRAALTAPGEKHD